MAHSGKIGGVVLNIDVGGGTSKFAICNNGKVQEVSAIDIGARLLAFDNDGAIVRIEEAGTKTRRLGRLCRRTRSESFRRKLCARWSSGMMDKLFAMLKPESDHRRHQGAAAAAAA